MGFKYGCKVRLFFEPAGRADIALKAIKPELDSNRHNRSETKIKINKGVLSLNIKALDAVALRASLNSSLKLIGLVEKIMEVE